MILVALLLLLLAALGAPLFAVISGSALFGFMSSGRLAADVTGEIGKLVEMDALITLPLFTFAGYLLAESGAPRRLVGVSRALFGWLPGGMALVALITCAFFTTFTGASGVTIVALGGLLLPMLRKEGYSEDFSLGLVTTGGSRGLLFPPSLPVIIYGYVAAVDITRLYVAGIVPGLIDVAVIAFLCVRAGMTAEVVRTPFRPKLAFDALIKALPEALLPVGVIALIFSGVLKVPEAAAMTALYVLVIEVVVYRDIHPLRDLPRVTKDAMVLCGAIIVILGASLGLTNYLVDRQIPQQVVTWISSTLHSKWVFLLAVNAFLLLVGCLMDIFSAIVIVVPLIAPLAVQFGVHPLHMAIIFLINLELGFNTPPVGMNLFISSFRFRQPIVRLYRAAIPFVLLNLVALAVITYVEPVSTFTAPKSPAGESQPSRTTTQPAQHARPPEALPDGLCAGDDPNDPDCDDIDIEADLEP